jgi:uncharacterized membrane protein YoaK (UPF0700 family)
MSETERPPQPLVLTLAGLTVAGGMLDAVSFLGLGHVFTANMTGNVVLIGFAAAGAPGFSVTASLTALGGFLAGAVVGGRMARQLESRRTLLLMAMVLETVLVGVAAVVAATVSDLGVGWPRFTVIALLAFSLGVRYTAVRRMGVPDMTTSVLTTTLTGLASDSSLAGGVNDHAVHRGTSVLCMFGGALVGAVLLLHVGAVWSLGAAAAIVAVTAAFYARQAPQQQLGLAH